MNLLTFKISKVDHNINRHRSSGYLLPVVITIVALIAFHGSANMPSTEQQWVKLDTTHWPVDILPEVQALERNNLPGTPIFNDMLFGGFLMYHTPGLRVFIDDRCELYGDDLIMKYVQAQKSDFKEWEKAYRFNFALLELNSSYRKYFDDDPGWIAIKRGQSAILYRRINRANKAGICGGGVGYLHKFPG